MGDNNQYMIHLILGVLGVYFMVYFWATLIASPFIVARWVGGLYSRHVEKRDQRRLERMLHSR